MSAASGAVPVALLTCSEYEPDKVAGVVARLFEAIDFRPSAGVRVLVKPNLVSVLKSGLACTHPIVVHAACRYLLDRGCKVTVGDSPAFGSAGFVARRSGYFKYLKGMDVPVVTLGRPMPLKLSFGARIGVSRDALDQDLLLNLPKLKCHAQMRMSLGVKNLFGCVAGMRKGVAHSRFGERENRFQAMINEVMLALPQAVTLLDGITAMHKSGPVRGKPYALKLLGASPSPVAMDTAMYSLLGLTPDLLPLWQESRARKLPGARAEDLLYPLQEPSEFDAASFEVPKKRDNVAFRPLRLIKSSFKRVVTGLRK
ncbi:MAG: DUF362 domain-containing protein [Desulfovibrio sp.]|mgnify:CR=1 FL=1|nr:MAG: DUF362 domain-containing protein [Desulfovibrio sp.]